MVDTRTVDTPPWEQKLDGVRSWERSLLRGARPFESRASANQRPAGPSAASSPGIAVPASPLPPGTRSADPNALPTHPQVAVTFRHNFSMPPDKDPVARQYRLIHTNGR